MPSFAALVLLLHLATAVAFNGSALGTVLAGHSSTRNRYRTTYYRLRKMALAAGDYELNEPLTRLHFAVYLGTAENITADRADVRAVVYRRLTGHLEILDYMVRKLNTSSPGGDEEVSGPSAVLLEQLARAKVLIELYPVGIAQGLSPTQAEEACEPTARRVADALARCGPARVEWANFAEFERWIESQISAKSADPAG